MTFDVCMFSVSLVASGWFPLIFFVCSAGFAGHDTPSAVFPSIVGWLPRSSLTLAVVGVGCFFACANTPFAVFTSFVAVRLDVLHAVST